MSVKILACSRKQRFAADGVRTSVDTDPKSTNPTRLPLGHAATLNRILTAFERRAKSGNWIMVMSFLLLDYLLTSLH